MKSTDQLSHDHELILRSLEILKAAADSWRSYREGAVEDCRDLVALVKTLSDCHHHKEERALFPKLIQAGMPADHGPLRTMMYEHDQARDLIRGMEQALRGTSPSSFVLHAKRYADLLAEHIEKEDKILFVKAANLLTREEDEAIFRSFDQIEHGIGEETHDTFREMLDTLALRYVPKPAA